MTLDVAVWATVYLMWDQAGGLSWKRFEDRDAVLEEVLKCRVQ